MHSSLQISGPQSQLRSRVLIGGSVSQSHSDHGAQSPGSHFSEHLFYLYHINSHRKCIKIILLIENKTYHMVHYCKVLLRQSLLRILVLANQFLVHRNRVRSSSFWCGVEFLKIFSFYRPGNISKNFKRFSKTFSNKFSKKKSKFSKKKFD